MKEFKRLLIDLILGKDSIKVTANIVLNNTDGSVIFTCVSPIVIPKGKFHIEKRRV